MIILLPLLCVRDTQRCEPVDACSCATLTFILLIVTQRVVCSQEEAEDEWEIAPEELLLGPRIGVGSFGEVYRGSWRHTDVAVKRLLEQEHSDNVMKVRCHVRQHVTAGACCSSSSAAGYVGATRQKELPTLHASPPRYVQTLNPRCVLMQEFRQEVAIMKRMKHPNVVRASVVDRCVDHACSRM